MSLRYMMDSFLGDMEAMDEGGDQRSRTTIKQIRKLVYDAEDVIESYILEASFPLDKTEALFKRYVCLGSSLYHTHQVGFKIEAIKAKIAKTLESWRKYAGPNIGGIRKDVGAEMNTGRWTRPPAYSHTEEEHVVGLEKDINKLVVMLTTNDTKIQVLSIVGMGGSGKTTLTRKLYNHESVKRHFNCIAWLSISKEWDAQQVLFELLRGVSGKTMRKDETQSLQELVKNIYEYLEGKRYLIVLDDVWTKEALEMIYPALPNDGRRIIITTRIREVADFPDLKCSIHEPSRLTEEDSWELFRKIALIHRERSNNSMDNNIFETLGREMLKKCQGLPLAVIALAGILSKKETLDEWEKVKKAVASRIMEEGRGTHLYGPVNEMLTLSYNDLRRDLKPCFLYLAMFPEDMIIQTGRMIRMWIAEGFITSNMLQEGETLEDVARDHLEELIDRCVVQIVSSNYKGEVKSIQVHDLVRDLCARKAKQQNFLEIFTSQSSNLDARVTELRRTTLYSKKRCPPLPTHSPHLRSLLCQGRFPFPSSFKLLRVLFIEGVEYPTLPKGIGSLIHLRYLALMGTHINQMHESVGNLRNLQHLEWRDNAPAIKREVIWIPDVLWKIESLKHLSIPYQRCNIKGGRWKLHTLKCLHTLKGIKGGPWMLEELPRLSPTVEKLEISHISSEEQLQAVFRCPSIMSDGLHSLELEWDVDTEQGKVVMLENLQPIRHCQHLRKLRLWGRIQDTLSSCKQFPTSIIKLELGATWFGEEVELATLGELPHLMCLKLGWKSYMGAKWTLISGQFTQLKELHLLSLVKLEEWSVEAGAMPQLRTLRIDGYKKLRTLPEGLKFITTLKELQLCYMRDEFKKRAGGGGKDAHIIQHVPRVYFLP